MQQQDNHEYPVLYQRQTFFFSSRRRHTRWPRDWSSDVCSSDLSGAAISSIDLGAGSRIPTLAEVLQVMKIGRASCRERVWISVVAVSLKEEKASDTARFQALSVGRAAVRS